MKKTIIRVMLVIMVVVLIGGVFAGCSDVNKLKAGIAERDAKITEKNIQIERLEDEAAVAEARIAERDEKIEEQGDQLTRQTTKIRELEGEAAITEARIAERDAKITEKNGFLIIMESEIEGLKEQLAGIESLRNPTYREVVDFVKTDKTDEKEGYQIFHLAAELNNNAEKAGFRAAYARLTFSDNKGWFMVLFQTTDRGIVGVDPVSDTIGPELYVGQKFSLKGWKETYVLESFVIAW